MSKKIVSLLLSTCLLFGSTITVMAAEEGEGDTTQVITGDSTVTDGTTKSASAEVYADNMSAVNFSVTLPKKVVLTDDDNDGIFTGTFTEKCSGDVPGGMGVSIGFADGQEFKLKSDGKADVAFTLTANVDGTDVDHTTNATEFECAEMAAETPPSVACTITTGALTAGEWKSNLTFKITYETLSQ